MSESPPAVAHETEYCSGCPLRERQFVPGEGDSACACLVVGAAPGKTEELTGRAFSGPAGLLVREVLGGYGLEAYLTNVLKRRPISADGSSNRKPTKGECWRCGSHLIEEIVRNRASVVLTLGQTATAFFLGPQARASQIHGLPIRVTKFQQEMVIIPSYDPAYVLRQGGLNTSVGDAFLGAIEEAIQVMVRKNV